MTKGRTSLQSGHVISVGGPYHTKRRDLWRYEILVDFGRHCHEFACRQLYAATLDLFAVDTAKRAQETKSVVTLGIRESTFGYDLVSIEEK